MTLTSTQKKLKRPALIYGGVPVPYTVSWSSEQDSFYVAPCEFSGGRMAICEASSIGVGKPRFGKPHSQRQREAIALGLCDLCGMPLTMRTKVSLSHARVRMNGAEGPAILQVEPLLHKECASISMEHCPSLKRDIAEGTLMIRQVSRFRVQFAVMDEVYVEQLTGECRKAIGHAKVELLRWKDRSIGWLA